MGRKLIAMGVGMGGVLFCEYGFLYRLMRRVREGTGYRMMPGIFQLAIPVLARACFYQG